MITVKDGDFLISNIGHEDDFRNMRYIHFVDNRIYYMLNINDTEISINYGGGFSGLHWQTYKYADPTDITLFIGKTTPFIRELIKNKG